MCMHLHLQSRLFPMGSRSVSEIVSKEAMEASFLSFSKNSNDDGYDGEDGPSRTGQDDEGWVEAEEGGEGGEGKEGGADPEQAKAARERQLVDGVIQRLLAIHKAKREQQEVPMFMLSAEEKAKAQGSTQVQVGGGHLSPPHGLEGELDLLLCKHVHPAALETHPLLVPALHLHT